MTLGQVDFYSHKGTGLPRFIYRRLVASLQKAQGSQARADIISAFMTRLASSTSEGDFLKFKWVLPTSLRDLLMPDERAMLENKLAEIRAKRSAKLFDVYPHCSDEFSLDAAFLDSTFGAVSQPLFDRQTSIFTLGSCFARNIAVYLNQNGFNAHTFGQVEDLNSPLSNALMLAVTAAPEQERHDYLGWWIGKLLVGQPEEVVHAVMTQELARLEKLRGLVAGARLLTITLGNTIDYFLVPEQKSPRIGGEAVAPKFLTVGASEDLNIRNAFSKVVRQAGAELRLASFIETRTAIQCLYDSLREINGGAPIVFTLSPVPIDSAMGIRKSQPYGAVEIDCISKSTLRTAIAELLASWNDPRVHYFPSYEIVRWVGSMLPTPSFGMEDAASRHVSENLLNAIYAFFLRRHGPA